MIVPAVTEVSFPQAAHSQLARRRFSPQPLSSAGGADEAVGPAPGGEMPGTGGFIGKARLEGGAGHGAVIFPAAGHDETLHEHPADAHQKLNISSNRAQRDKPFTAFPSRPGVLRQPARPQPPSRQQRRTRFGTSPASGVTRMRWCEMLARPSSTPAVARSRRLPRSSSRWPTRLPARRDLRRALMLSSIRAQGRGARRS